MGPSGLKADIGPNVQDAELALLADGRIAIAFSRGNGGEPDLADNNNVRTYIIDPRDGQVTGSDENDQLTAAPAGSFVFGRDGNDTLYGVAGEDNLSGDDGADIISGNGGDDSVSGGNDDDIVSGGDGEDKVYGGGGNDFLTGGADSDSLYGGSGDDQLLGGDGADAMYGGTGSDRYAVNRPDDFLQESNSSMGGLDTVTSEVSWVLGDYFEDLILSGIAQSGRGNALGNGITGNSQANIIGGEGGVDTLMGKNGDDILIGGTGADLLDGGNGIDIASYRFSAARIEITLDASFAPVGDPGIDAYVSIEGLEGTDFNDRLAGNTSANRLIGGDGNDNLTGRAGNDVIRGGTGGDTMSCGQGSDIFEYTATNQGNDVIVDFTSGTDKFQFSAATFGGGLVSGAPLPPGRLQVSAFDSAVNGNVRFFFDTDTFVLRFDADGSGAGSSFVIATLQNGATLAAGDFIIA